MSPNSIDLMDALDMLSDAEEIITSFSDVISASLDGDHPDALKVQEWLRRYDNQ